MLQNDNAAAEAAEAEGDPSGANPDNSPESLGHTLSWLRRAVELDPSSYDAWHAWALMNYQLTEVHPALFGRGQERGGVK